MSDKAISENIKLCKYARLHMKQIMNNFLNYTIQKRIAINSSFTFEVQVVQKQVFYHKYSLKNHNGLADVIMDKLEVVLQSHCRLVNHSGMSQIWPSFFYVDKLERHF